MKNNKIIILGIMILFLVSSVFAFAVSVPYMKDKQLYLLPGQETDFQIVLQDSGAETDIKVQANIDNGSEIMKFTETNNIYTIPIGGKGKVDTKITIPASAQIGDVYDMELSFTTVTDTGGGGFKFGSSILQRFQVVVGEAPSPSPESKEPAASLGGIISNPWLWIIGIIILIGIIWYIIKRRNNFTIQKTISPARKKK